MEDSREKVYQYVVDYLQAHMYSPTLREIGSACGFSQNTAMWHVNKLIEEGRLERVQYIRGLQVPERSAT